MTGHHYGLFYAIYVISTRDLFFFLALYPHNVNKSVLIVPYLTYVAIVLSYLSTIIGNQETYVTEMPSYVLCR